MTYTMSRLSSLKFTPPSTGKSFYLPIGPPGCGKSTLAAELVTEGVIPLTAIVSPDELRERLTDDRSNQQCNRTAYEIVDRIISYRMKEGLDIYLDATNLRDRDYGAHIHRALTSGYQVSVCLFDMDREEVIRRNKERKHVVPDEAMEVMFKRWEAVDLSQFEDHPRVTILTLGKED